MKRNIILIFIILTSLILHAQARPDAAVKRDTFKYFSIPDTNYDNYKLPPVFKKPEHWTNADHNRKGWAGESYGNSYPDFFILDNALKIIDTETDFLLVRSAKSWCLAHYEQAFPYLVTRLSDKRKIGLKNTADLIIWDRMGTGDLEFYGHGGNINEDIFTISGRASWILNQLTGETFAEVHGDFTEEQSAQFKLLWKLYIEGLDKS
jgi:hypothetical protein